MWGNVAVTQAYLTLSEVLGHLDLLVEAGQAIEREADGTARFEAVAVYQTDSNRAAGLRNRGKSAD